MSKRLQNNEVIGLVGTSASEWIQEIQAGETTHAIAVKHGIKFFNGKQDTEGIEWDGVQDLEVIIPTLADIVSNPVTLKGVIDDAEDIPSSVSNGDLYYIGTDGVTVGGQLCEAGDMAIYYNNAWHVISGENQITINAAAATVDGADNLFTISGTAKTLLTVEGKTLSVALDYADVAAKTKVVKDGLAGISVVGGTVAVDGMSIALTYTSSASQDIATGMSIDLPTSLASGAVSIDQNVLEASNFSFTSGSLATATKNAASISIDASTNISVEGTFVTEVSAVGGVSIVSTAAADTADKIAFATGLSAVSGTDFITNVRVYDSTKDEGKTPAFEIPGAVTVTGVSTFVTGLGATEAASGDVVTSVSVGAVTIATGNDIVTGLTGEGSTVLTSVEFGSASKSADQWFYDGLTEGSDVVTDVTVGAVSLVADNNGGAPAIVNASVNASHVLVFNTSNFQTPVTISQASSTISKKGFSKGGVTLTGFSSASDTLTFGGISQAATTVSFKDFATDSLSISLGSATQYFIDTAKDHAYTAEMGYAKLSVTDATVSTGSPSLTNTGITAAIPANTVVTEISGGVLPSFSVGAATGTLTGSVGTALTTESRSWLAVNPDKRNVAGAGSYALTSDSAAEGIVGSAITVAAADTYELANATVTIASGNFVTAVEISGVEASVKSNA